MTHVSGFWSQRRAIGIRAALNYGLFRSPVVIFRQQLPVCERLVTSPVVNFSRMRPILDIIDGQYWHLVAHEVLCSLTWNVVRGSQWPIFISPIQFGRQKEKIIRERELDIGEMYRSSVSLFDCRCDLFRDGRRVSEFGSIGGFSVCAAYLGGLCLTAGTVIRSDGCALSSASPLPCYCWAVRCVDFWFFGACVLWCKGTYCLTRLGVCGLDNARYELEFVVSLFQLWIYVGLSLPE